MLNMMSIVIIFAGTSFDISFFTRHCYLAFLCSLLLLQMTQLYITYDVIWSI